MAAVTKYVSNFLSRGGALAPLGVVTQVRHGGGGPILPPHKGRAHPADAPSWAQTAGAPIRQGLKNYYIYNELKDVAEALPKEVPFAHKVLIVGGGCGGMAVARNLARKFGEGRIAIIDPAEHHYYQPAWTLVGAGQYNMADTRYKISHMVPKKIKLYKAAVTEFVPDENHVLTDKFGKIKYDFLVVATGIKIDWDEVKGLKEAMGRDGVTTNYSPNFCELTHKMIRGVKKGTAIFTMPPANRIKCPGAPQKIMYLAEEIWRTEMGVRDNVNIKFITANPGQFAVKKYADSLNKICDERGLERTYKSNLIAIDPDKREATFKRVGEGSDGSTFTERYSFIHVSPPMSPPDVVKKSPLANEAGFVDVHPTTMIHTKYANVFGIGDCTSVPTSKTAAAAAVEAYAVCENVFGASTAHTLHGHYDGYASCPLVVSKNQCIMAEFNAFTGEPWETFPIDQGKPSYLMHFMKKYVLPVIYWEAMMRGIWHGPGLFREAFAWLPPFLTAKKVQWVMKDSQERAREQAPAAASA
ncbi:unnamed protein product [Vitrella brassicaformis CCMP3155]|uniref:Sulfide:quinone oxidoreductase, mitochondrial n=1 Tax=Vitrella brassicaformis (strain CCMP3155) TaxID=1169540 RepID=A0A0G4F2F4_VITBC|nr:unnamed protein product [Vitrella brassicaformis CCMP3155]|eukprot:CEM06370.1 unnamed protein product [Vitrella brassicaformis CCMP3155]